MEDQFVSTRLYTTFSVKPSAVTSQCELSQRCTWQNTGQITNFSEATLHDRLNRNSDVTYSVTEAAAIYSCALKHWYTQGFCNISCDTPN